MMAEDAMRAAEVSRVEAEAARVGAEHARGAAEEARIGAERARGAAEEAREALVAQMQRGRRALAVIVAFVGLLAVALSVATLNLARDLQRHEHADATRGASEQVAK